MSEKLSKIPDSDISARKPNSAEDDDLLTPGTDEGRQTSNKSGKHSTVEKLAASRPEFATAPGATPKAGAFGKAKPPGPGMHGLPGDVSQKVPKTRKKK